MAMQQFQVVLRHERFLKLIRQRVFRHRKVKEVEKGEVAQR